jgi:hypothetical protein
LPTAEALKPFAVAEPAPLTAIPLDKDATPLTAELMLDE